MHFIDWDYWIKIKQRNKMYGLAFVLFSVVSSLHFLLNLNLVYLVSSSSNIHDPCPVTLQDCFILDPISLASFINKVSICIAQMTAGRRKLMYCSYEVRILSCLLWKMNCITQFYKTTDGEQIILFNPESNTSDIYQSKREIVLQSICENQVVFRWNTLKCSHL